MDPLALLCTLHADGPATLRRLRAAGCGTLEQLADLGVERLGELLAVSPPVARRFLREAARLGARVGVDAFGREEVLHAASSASAGEAFAADGGAGGARAESAPRADSAPAASEAPRAEPAPSVEEPGARLGLAERELLRRVVDRWREADEADGGAAPRAPVPARAEREPSAAPAPGIALYELEGADAPLRARLEEEGLCDVRAVAALDPVDLARRLGLPYTRARRLQFSARRLCAARAPAPAAAREEPERKISLSFREGASLHDELPAALPALDDGAPRA